MSPAMPSILRKLTWSGTTLLCSDEKLLHRFNHTKDEASFATLVKRHGAMVMQVCRQILPEAHDAEDACQTTFLVLAQQSHRIVKAASVKSWLYGVALRVSHQARRGNLRQAKIRSQLQVNADVLSPAELLSASDLHQAIKAELLEMPETYRRVLELCYWEGQSREEMAEELGWTEGTVKGQLERAKKRLRSQLLARGIEWSAPISMGLLATAVASMVSPALIACSSQFQSVSFTSKLLACGTKISYSLRWVATLKSISSMLLLSATLHSQLPNASFSNYFSNEAVEVEATNVDNCVSGILPVEGD